MASWSVGLFLILTAAAFAALGVGYARRRVGSLEDYITARGSVGPLAAAVTLVASGMGAWILFSPAEAATRGGLPTLLGYGLGAAAPLVAFVPLGRRLRQLMPAGHTLTEYVWHRYGRGMYVFTLLVMLFYMFIYLAAETTGMALLAHLVAGLPLWLTAAVVLAATLLYTAYGGLRASIFTDSLQALLILPLLVALLLVGGAALGGVAQVTEALRARAPQLLQWHYGPGIEVALTLIVAILAANLFHQGYWQRVYAVRDAAALRAAFLIAALLVIPIVAAVGLFGLAAVALERAQTPSVALFHVLLGTIPEWLVVGLVLLGLALAMSSVDTLCNGIASLVAVDLHRALPQLSARALLRVSRIVTVGLALPVLWIAAQGYSVLYLFLIADLVCAAAVFPVFFGLYSARYTGTVAVLSTLAGLLAGGLLFPPPDFGRGSLLGAFVLAALVPVGVSLVLTPRRAAFDFTRLQRQVQLIQE
ncbi:MAG: urea transporter [Candidatus Tectimicrobiota bacterium]|nr:MAG: urea transporter [Candidatus Tectomicrobia bacterium]